MVRQRSAKPLSAVRFRPAPPDALHSVPFLHPASFGHSPQPPARRPQPSQPSLSTSAAPAMIYIHRAMERLNYHHLLYFFTVAREGSVARASAQPGSQAAHRKRADPRPGTQAGTQTAGAQRTRPQGHSCRRDRVALRREHLRPGRRDADGARRPQLQPAPKLAVGVSSSLPPALAAILLKRVFGLEPRPLVTIVEAPAAALAAQLAARVPSLCPGRRQARQRRVGPRAQPPAAGESGRAVRAAGPGPQNAQGFSRAPGWRACPDALAGRLAPARLTVGSPRASCGWRQLAEMPHPEIYALTGRSRHLRALAAARVLADRSWSAARGRVGGRALAAFLATAGKGARQPAVDAVISAARRLL